MGYWSRSEDTHTDSKTDCRMLGTVGKRGLCASVSVGDLVLDPHWEMAERRRPNMSDDIRDNPLAPWNAIGLVIPWVAAQLSKFTEPELDRTLEAVAQAEIGQDGSFYLQLAIRRKPQKSE